MLCHHDSPNGDLALSGYVYVRPLVDDISIEDYHRTRDQSGYTPDGGFRYYFAISENALLFKPNKKEDVARIFIYAEVNPLFRSHGIQTDPWHLEVINGIDQSEYHGFAVGHEIFINVSYLTMIAVMPLRRID